MVGPDAEWLGANRVRPDRLDGQMDEALGRIAERAQAEAFGDGGDGVKRDAGGVEIGGLAKQMLGVGNPADLTVAPFTADPGGDDHRDIEGVAQGFQLEQQLQRHFRREAIAISAAAVTGELGPGKMGGGTGAVKGDAAKRRGKEPVFGEHPDLAVRVQPTVLLKGLDRLGRFGPGPAIQRAGLITPGRQGGLDL